MAYTLDQYLMLSQLAYLDMEKIGGGKLSIRSLYARLCWNRKLLEGRTGSLSLTRAMELFANAAADSALRSLRLLSHVNRNVNNGVEGGSGLVGYVFEASNGDHLFTFRGSEGDLASGNEDWLDNFNLATGDSLQNREALIFAALCKTSLPAKNYATGHSLGGSHAMAIAGVFGMGGMVFNARGVAPKIVQEYAGKGIDFQRNLDEHGFRSIRTEGDPISSLKRLTWRPMHEELVPAIPFHDQNEVLIAPVPPELVPKVHALYDAFEQFVMATPTIHHFIMSILHTGSRRKLSVIEGAQLAWLRTVHWEAWEYVFQSQAEGAPLNLMAPHDSLAIQDPSRGRSGAARYLRARWKYPNLTFL